MSGTNEGVSDGYIVGKMGIPKLGQVGASVDKAETGVAQGNTDGTENVLSEGTTVGIEDADRAVYEGLSSDQGGKNTDLVRSVSRERGDPSKSASWISIVSASSKEDEYAGFSSSADIADANRATSAVAGVGDITAGRSKGRSTSGKDWDVTIAKSEVRFTPVGSEVNSGFKKPATDVTQTEENVVFVDAGAVDTNLLGSAPTKLDLCRSEISDAAVNGSGVTGTFNTVAFRVDAGATTDDADKGISGTISDTLGSAMLSSVHAGSEKCA